MLWYLAKDFSLTKLTDFNHFFKLATDEEQTVYADNFYHSQPLETFSSERQAEDFLEWLAMNLIGSSYASSTDNYYISHDEFVAFTGGEENGDGKDNQQCACEQE